MRPRTAVIDINPTSRVFRANRGGVFFLNFTSLRAILRMGRFMAVQEYKRGGKLPPGPFIYLNSVLLSCRSPSTVVSPHAEPKRYGVGTLKYIFWSIFS